MHGRSAGGKPGQAANAATQAMARRGFGPRPLGALLAPLLRPAFARRAPAKRAPAIAQLAADWPTIVGPRLAEMTTPRRLAAGTLTRACTGAVGLELQHTAPALLERINTHLGRKAVTRLRLVQNLLPPLACAVAAADPAILETVERRLEGFPASDLRNALAALGRAVHAAARR